MNRNACNQRSVALELDRDPARIALVTTHRIAPFHAPLPLLRQGAYALGLKTRQSFPAGLLDHIRKDDGGKGLDAERSGAANERRRSNAIPACPSEAIPWDGRDGIERSRRKAGRLWATIRASIHGSSPGSCECAVAGSLFAREPDRSGHENVSTTSGIPP